MFIWVCSLTRTDEMVRFHKPERILSLMSPEDGFPSFSGYTDKTHLKLAVDDVGGAISAGQDAPGEQHAEAIITFASQWPQHRPMLIHCLAGVSRSSAAAFITICALNPKVDPEDVALEIRRNSITARPNPHLIAHADRLLHRRGRMIAALQTLKDSWEFHPEHDVMPYKIDSGFAGLGGHQ